MVSATSVTFNLAVVDDNVVDGTKSATINAVASGHAEAFKTISITDNEVLTLRPGAIGDVVNVRPAAQAGQFELTKGPAPIAGATPLAVVDLTTITAGDQRVALDAPTGTPYSRAQGLVKVALNQRTPLGRRRRMRSKRRLTRVLATHWAGARAGASCHR